VARFQVAAKHASAQIAASVSGSTPVDLVMLPGKGSSPSSVETWAASVDRVPPSAIDTRDSLEQTVRDRLATGSGAVMVISDRRLPLDDPRLIQFSPEGAIDNVGISLLAARETPLPQMMVRLRNDSSRKSVGVKITSGSIGVTKTVDLPPAGQEWDYFFDLPKLGDVIDASLDVKDDQPADDRAWLVREGSYPKIETRFPVSAEVRRMIDVYSRSRQATENSPTIAVVGAEADLPADAPAVWIPPATGSTAHGTVSAAAHPVTANVNWSAFPADVQTAGDPPRGWTPLLTIGDHVIVAARTEPTRKVWVGFSPSNWSATPDFVVFWANVFNWLGQGQEHFAAHPLAKFEPGWKPVETSAPNDPVPGEWPGLYRADEGGLRAYHLTAESKGPPAQTTPDWRDKLRLADGMGTAGYDLSPAIVLLGLAILAAAALTWKRRTLTPVSAGRTFSVVRK
jgi:hypothetical protein